MLQIAGGILIAIAALVALPLIVIGAYWALVIGIGFIILAGVWFGLAAAVGPGWALAISIAAVVFWLGRSGMQDAEREKAKADEQAQQAKAQEAKMLARQEIWAGEQRAQYARIEAWKAEEQARNELEMKERQAGVAAIVAKRKTDREICLKALRDGRDVIAMDGRKMTLQDFDVYE